MHGERCEMLLRRSVYRLCRTCPPSCSSQSVLSSVRCLWVGRWAPTHSVALRALCGRVHLFTPTVIVPLLPCKCISFFVKIPFSQLLCCGLAVGPTWAMLGLADKVNFLLLTSVIEERKVFLLLGCFPFWGKICPCFQQEEQWAMLQEIKKKMNFPGDRKWSKT